MHIVIALVLIAALEATPAPIAAPAAIPPGTYHYTAFQKGKEVGNSTVTVARIATGTKIDERSNVNLAGGDSKAQTAMVLDDHLGLSAYHGHYEAAEQSMDAVITLGTREATMTAGKDIKVVPLGGTSKGFIVLDAGMIAGFAVLPAQMHALNNSDTTVLVPGTGESSFIDVIPDNTVARPADVPTNDLSISFAGPSPFVEWYDPQTYVVDQIAIPGQDLIVKRQQR